MTTQEVRQTEEVIESAIKRTTNSKSAFKWSAIATMIGIISGLVVSCGTLYTTVDTARTNAEIYRKAQAEKTAAEIAAAIEANKRKQLVDDTAVAVTALKQSVDSHTSTLNNLTTLVQEMQKLQAEDHKVMLDFLKHSRAN